MSARPDGHQWRGWWSSIGAEGPVASETCATEGCRATLSSVDLYCPDDEHPDFLLFRDTAAWVKYSVVGGLAAAIVALLVLAADNNSRWPLYLLAVAVGGAAIGLVLHAHAIGRTVGLALWCCVSLAAAAVASSSVSDGNKEAIWTIALALLLLVVLFVGLSADTGAADDEDAFVVFSGPMMVAVVALTFRWATDPHPDRFVTLPDFISAVLLVVGIGAVVVTILLTVVTAFAAALDEMTRTVRDLLKPPRRGRVTWRYVATAPRMPVRRTFQALVRWRVVLVGQRVGRAMLAVVRLSVNSLLAAVFVVERAIVRVINVVIKGVVLTARLAAWFVGGVAALAVFGTGDLLKRIACCRRPLTAYACAIGGSVVALHVASAYLSYLVDGPLTSLAAGTAWSILGLAACLVLSERLSSEPTATVLAGEGRLLQNAGPVCAIFVIGLGWVTGLLGMLGYGPIRIGWITGGGTAAIAVLAIHDLIRQHRESRRVPSQLEQT